MSFLELFSRSSNREKKPQPQKSEAPAHWIKCESCNALMYYKEVENQLYVCPKCGHHIRIGVKHRIQFLLDENSFEESDSGLKPVDPIKFVDKKSYRKRIEEAYEKNNRYSAVVSGSGKIDGVSVEIAIFDFSFMGGSLGSVEGEKIYRTINRAIERRRGVIIVSASGGARMQESTFSLMQMAKTSAALAKLSEAGLPYISILTDPTMGGVSASFATLGDIIIAEPNALVGFAGQRVIKQTIGSDLPEGFQRAEFLLDHGAIDMIVKRKDMRETVGSLLKLLMQKAEEKEVVSA